MVVFRSNTWKGVRLLKPDTLVLLFLTAWWGLNLLQAALTGLADDEAYYWYYAQHLDWGYFDHPPMVALLVRLSSWLPGLLGIRFFSTLLQPLYLLLFWHLIRPADATRRDALVYALLCFSQPLLQLYGFLAVPDAPLMLFTVVFLWAYRRFLREGSLLNALWLGISVALLGYSKYHGALVVALVLLSNPKLFRRWQFYVAGAVALALFLPHLWWQYQHDWVSLHYHLMDRNAWGYKPNFTLEYLATLAVLFNPLWLYHFVKALRCPADGEERPMRRAGIVMLAGFWVFFLVATFRGTVQPQWLLPTVFPFMALVFYAARRTRFVCIVGWVCVTLFVAVRLLAVANPMHLRGQLWEGAEPYHRLAAVANGRPVEFVRCYAFAAKYAYYTGCPAHCTSYFYDRQSQWQFDTADRAFAGCEVVVAALGDLHGERLEVNAPRDIRYMVFPDYMPMRELTVRTLEPIDVDLRYLSWTDTTRPVDSLPLFEVPLAITNPYPYDIVPDKARPIAFYINMQYDARHAPSAVAPLTDTLRAGATTVVRPRFRFPNADVPDGILASGIAVGYTRFAPALNTAPHTIAVRHDDEGVHLKADW